MAHEGAWMSRSDEMREDPEALVGEVVNLGEGRIGPVVLDEVAALNHEVLDHAVHRRVLVSNRHLVREGAI